MKCPICRQVISTNPYFSKIELNQGGKNIICSFCKQTLWIPIRGNPISVRVLVVLGVKEKEAL